MSTHSRSVYSISSAFLDTRLEEMEMPEDRVLEKLNTVSTAKRLANMVRNSVLIKIVAEMRDIMRDIMRPGAQ